MMITVLVPLYQHQYRVLYGKLIPVSFAIVNEDNKCNWAIDRAKGHDSVGVLPCVWASKGQLFLRFGIHTDLVKPLRGIQQPAEFASAHGNHRSEVTTRYGVGDNLGDTVETDVVNA
jgi:hypothetical protein